MKDEMLLEAKRLYDLGFAIQWLKPKSKEPIDAKWTTGPRKNWEELKSQYQPGFNLSTRLGTPAKLAHGYLAVIDVDVKSDLPHHREEALAAASVLIGAALCPVVVSGRGNGSCHYYCVTEKPFKTFNAAWSEETINYFSPTKKVSRREREQLTEKQIANGLRLGRAWEVSCYSDGRQVVLPPSVHPDSGKKYSWRINCAEAPHLPVRSLLPSRVGTTDVVSDASQHTTNLVPDFKVEPVDLGWLPIASEIRKGIETCEGVADRSGFMLLAATALVSAGLNENEILSVLTDPTNALSECAYEHAKTSSRKRAAEWVSRYTLKKVVAERETVREFAKTVGESRKLSEAEMAATAAEFAEARDWRQDILKTQHGKPQKLLQNVNLFMVNVLEDPFREDEFACKIEYSKDVPWGRTEGTPLEDIDLTLMRLWLSQKEGIEPSKDLMQEASVLNGHNHKYHPVRNWLQSLKWDGEPRIKNWLKKYCKGDGPQPYLSEVSELFLLAMVKRIFDPGCQWDYVLILEGKQGHFKSSIARALASDKWFMDNLPDLKDKDSMLNLCGKWVIELGELADVKRADYNLVKAYLTRRTDNVRPHYARLPKEIDRQSVFIGTINEGQYLKDPTGNRRYWPVKVGLCDVQGLLSVRDQLFAEAMHIHLNSEKILVLSEEAEKQAREVQDDRRVDDDESEMKEALLIFMQQEAEKPEKERFHFEQFRLVDLMRGNGPWIQYGNKGYIPNIAGHVLTSLGFKRSRSHGVKMWKIGCPLVPPVKIT